MIVMYILQLKINKKLKKCGYWKTEGNSSEYGTR